MISPVENQLRIFDNKNNYYIIELNKDSGRVLWRFKKNNPFNIKHTGLYIGVDIMTKNHIIIHNHQDPGFPSITSFVDFAQGMKCYFEDSPCINEPKTVITRALQHVMENKPYKVTHDNCQTLTNSACHNVRRSEDVSRISNGLLGAALVVTLSSLALGRA